MYVVGTCDSPCGSRVSPSRLAACSLRNEDPTRRRILLVGSAFFGEVYVARASPGNCGRAGKGLSHLDEQRPMRRHGGLVAVGLLAEILVLPQVADTGCGPSRFRSDQETFTFAGWLPRLNRPTAVVPSNSGRAQTSVWPFFTNPPRRLAQGVLVDVEDLVVGQHGQGELVHAGHVAADQAAATKAGTRARCA